MALVLVAVGLFVYSRFGGRPRRRARLRPARARRRPRRDGRAPRAASAPGRRPPRRPRREPGAGARPGRPRRVLEPRARRTAAPDGRRARARAGAAPSSSTATPWRGFDEHLRLLAMPAAGGPRRGRRARPREDREEALSALAQLLLIGGPWRCCLLRSPRYGVARAALRPVERDAAPGGRDLATGAAGACRCRRAATSSPRSAATLNEMLDRLEARAERERGFVAERQPRAAHAARAPARPSSSSPCARAARPRSSAAALARRPRRPTGWRSSPRTCWCSPGPTRGGCPSGRSRSTRASC